VPTWVTAAIAAHGHADALSIDPRLDRRDVLVDPGTYDSFTFPEWRQYFRKTCSHNRLMIDDQDQSELQGAFLFPAIVGLSLPAKASSMCTSRVYSGA
jgi:hypothetical protein